MITTLFGGAWRWLVAGLGLLVGYEYWRRKQQQEGRDEARAEQRIADAQAIRERQRTDQAVRSLGDDELRRRLRDSKYRR